MGKTDYSCENLPQVEALFRKFEQGEPFNVIDVMLAISDVSRASYCENSGECGVEHPKIQPDAFCEFCG